MTAAPYYQLPACLAERAGLSLTAKVLWSILRDLERRWGPDQVYPSRETLARMYDRSLSGLRRDLAELEATGLLVSEARPGRTALRRTVSPGPQAGRPTHEPVQGRAGSEAGHPRSEDEPAPGPQAGRDPAHGRAAIQRDGSTRTTQIEERETRAREHTPCSDSPTASNRTLPGAPAAARRLGASTEDAEYEFELARTAERAYRVRYEQARPEAAPWLGHAKFYQAFLDVARQAVAKPCGFEEALDRTLASFFADSYARQKADYSPDLLARQFNRHFAPPSARGPVSSRGPLPPAPPSEFRGDGVEDLDFGAAPKEAAHG